jgi:hypothetical protein
MMGCEGLGPPGLLSCPFCGGCPGWDHGVVTCKECGATGQKPSNCADMQLTAGRWNKRVTGCSERDQSIEVLTRALRNWKNWEGQTKDVAEAIDSLISLAVEARR